LVFAMSQVAAAALALHGGVGSLLGTAGAGVLRHARSGIRVSGASAGLFGEAAIVRGSEHAWGASILARPLCKSAVRGPLAKGCHFPRQ
jgi:hypothetical protein